MAGGEHRQSPVDVFGRDDRDHADAHVERLLHLGALHTPALGDQTEHGSGAPRRAVELGDEPLRHHPREIRGEAATGDMAEGTHLRLGGEGQAVLRVDTGGLEELFAEGAAELVDMRRQAHLADLEQHLAGQGVTVGMQTRRPHREDDVARTDPIRPENLLRLDHTDTGRGDVVVTVRHHTRMLGGLTAQESTPGLDTALGDARDDLRDPLRHHTPDGDVILQEQRFRTAHHEVVDDHRDEVQTDRVVLVERLRDRELGAHAVGGRGEQRFLVVTLECEQTGEAAETAEHLRPGGPLRVRREQFDGPITGLDVHARRCVGSSGGCVLGHGLSAPASC